MDEAKYAAEMYEAWRQARLAFIAAHPATAKALGLTVPPPTEDCHANHQ